jgi:hypothetical protein
MKKSLKGTQLAPLYSKQRKNGLKNFKQNRHLKEIKKQRA